MKNRVLKLAAVAAAGAIAYKYVWPHVASMIGNEPGQGRKKDVVEEFKDMARLKLKETQKLMDEIKVKLEDADDETRKRLRQTVESLEKRGMRILKSISDIKSEGEEGWEDIKQAFFDEFNAYKKELQDISI